MPLLLFSSLLSNAQQEREPRLWLTIPDRTAMMAPQAAALHFSSEAGQLPVYTSNRSGSISIDVNGKVATRSLMIASTFDASDPIAWRQWHHWNIAHNLVSFICTQRREMFWPFAFSRKET